MKNHKYKIAGLDCANCANELERVLKKVEGVEEVNINFLTERMEITCDTLHEEEIIKNIKKTIKKNEPDVEIIDL